MSHNKVNFSTFLPRIQKEVAKDFNFKQTTVDSLSGFVDLLAEKLVNIISNLKRKTGKKTTDAFTVQTAVRLLFPEALAKFAISYATASVLKYNNNVEAKNTKEVVASNPSDTTTTTTTTPPTKPSALSTRSTQSNKAGLKLPVSRVARLLKQQSLRVSPQASIFLTAVLEFLVKEMIESASAVTTLGKRKQISVYDLNRSVFGCRTTPENTNAHKKKTSKTTTATTDEKAEGVVVGDVDLEVLSRTVNWGMVNMGWKGMYTDASCRKRQKLNHVKESDGKEDKGKKDTLESAVPLSASA